jgi:hypothetical protein
MDFRAILLAPAIACASCHRSQPAEENPPAAPLDEQTPKPAATAPDAIKPGEPGGLPDDRRPIVEGPIDLRSAQGAGQVLQQFGGLLEQRHFGEAYRLWSDNGRASGLSEAQFTSAYEKYAEIHSEVGAPGEAEGAAGQSLSTSPSGYMASSRTASHSTSLARSRFAESTTCRARPPSSVGGIFTEATCNRGRECSFRPCHEGGMR